MVLYIFVVAVLNLGVGCAVAVHLGARWQRLRGPERESRRPAAKFGDVADVEIPPADRGAPPEFSPDIDEVDEVDAAPDAQTHSGGDGAKDATAGAAAGEPPAEAEPSREKTLSEASVDDMKGHVAKYHEQLSELDERLRRSADEPDAGGIRDTLNELKDANDGYLHRQEDSHELFRQLHRDQEALKEACEKVAGVVHGQRDEIRETNQAVEEFDYDADLADGCRRIASGTGKLLEANDKLRDTLDATALESARAEGRLGEIDPAAREDKLTGLASRAGLEIELESLWKKDTQRARQMTVVMFDVDRFAQINQSYGHSAGNRLLKSLAELIEAETRKEKIAARYSGEKFMLVLPEADIRFTTHLAERIRQTVEVTRFLLDEEEIQVTVSCAVLEAVESTCEALFARVDATLREAKRYGRNRTFIHEENYPTPVVPPNFTLQEMTREI